SACIFFQATSLSFFGISSSFNVLASPYSWMRIAFIVTSMTSALGEAEVRVRGWAKTLWVDSKRSLLRLHTIPKYTSGRAKILAPLERSGRCRLSSGSWAVPIPRRMQKLRSPAQLQTSRQITTRASPCHSSNFGSRGGSDGGSLSGVAVAISQLIVNEQIFV